MELRQLKYFVHVADELHFGNAARKLFISQPALSQQVKLLEAELGVELFVKIKRTKSHKVELTQAGEAFLPDAKRILSLADKAVRDVRQVGAKQQVITLGVFKLILPERIMGILELFSSHFPAVEIKLVELPNPVQVQISISNGDLDMGLCVLPLVKGGLTANQYTQADYSILMNRNNLLAGRKAVRLAELKNEKWIDHGPEAGLFFGHLEEVCRSAGFHRESNIAHYVPSFELLKSMVRLDKGIAFIPASLDLQHDPSLISVPIANADGTPFKEIVIQHVLIYKTEPCTPLVQALGGLVKIQVQQTLELPT
ncbi:MULTISPECIES: LysR family transcriptional regulator [Dyadobacter]|uniref:LysR substrate-binding domain-containing protein n=1 Tax=Dyadobacter chenhuakuii TaxID=2909339 RepID=A0A9X1QGI3_9BACT|nr:MULTISPECIES: LysR substrate-binding domain-containing protein [Dyadobacter]MCF2501300.1 LysR substrate-binding domain-containing protein [Dyadobacter chenhuakuii]MCF2502121.1 LysR substrate-binding domain-containing protein [Dyadobacter fanqingshengii]